MTTRSKPDRRGTDRAQDFCPLGDVRQALDAVPPSYPCTGLRYSHWRRPLPHSAVLAFGLLNYAHQRSSRRVGSEHARVQHLAHANSWASEWRNTPLEGALGAEGNRRCLPRRDKLRGPLTTRIIPSRCLAVQYSLRQVTTKKSDYRRLRLEHVGTRPRPITCAPEVLRSVADTAVSRNCVARFGATPNRAWKFRHRRRSHP